MSSEAGLLRDYLDSFKNDLWETVSIPTFFAQFSADIVKSGWWQEPQANLIEVGTKNKVSAAGFELNADRRLLTRPDGLQVQLTPGETHVLYRLLANSGRVVPYASYYQPLHLDGGIAFSALTSIEDIREHCKKLRLKLEDTYLGDPKKMRLEWKYINTVYGDGFFFRGPGAELEAGVVVFADEKERERLKRFDRYLSLLRVRKENITLEEAFGLTVANLRQLGLLKEGDGTIVQQNVFKTSDGLVFDSERRFLARNGILLPLKKLETQVLHLLMACAGVVVPKIFFYGALWGLTEDRSQGLRDVINSLCSKLKMCNKGTDKKYIKTVIDAGYIFDAEVQKTPVTFSADPLDPYRLALRKAAVGEAVEVTIQQGESSKTVSTLLRAAAGEMGTKLRYLEENDKVIIAEVRKIKPATTLRVYT